MNLFQKEEKINACFSHILNSTESKAIPRVKFTDLYFDIMDQILKHNSEDLISVSSALTVNPLGTENGLFQKL